MGCRLSRTHSIDNLEIEEKRDSSTTNNSTTEKRGNISNGQSVLLRRDTPAGGLQVDASRTVSNGNGNGVLSSISSKPIGEVESASQADFFRMLDEKIAHGRGLDSEEDEP